MIRRRSMTKCNSCKSLTIKEADAAVVPIIVQDSFAKRKCGNFFWLRSTVNQSCCLDAKLLRCLDALLQAAAQLEVCRLLLSLPVKQQHCPGRRKENLAATTLAYNMAVPLCSSIPKCLLNASSTAQCSSSRIERPGRKRGGRWSATLALAPPLPL